MVQFIGQTQIREPASADHTKQFALLGETLGNALEKRRDRKTLLGIGEAYKQGDLAGAQKAAFEAGRPDIGMQIGKTLFDQNMSNQQMQYRKDALDETRAYHQGQLGVAQEGAALRKQSQQAESSRREQAAQMLGLTGQPAPQTAAQPNLYGDTASVPMVNPVQTPQASPQRTAQPQKSPQMKAEYGALVLDGSGPSLAKASKMRREWKQGAQTGRVALQGAVSKLKLLQDDISKLVASPGLENMSGAVGKYTPSVRQTTIDAEGRLKSIQAKVAFGQLQAMREASKTGGALGAIAVRELDLLQGELAAIEPGMSASAMKESLQKIEKHYHTAVTSMAQSQQEQYGTTHGIEIPKPLVMPAQPGGTIQGVQWGFN